jgi:S1-C subfamily serine protease
MRVMILGGGAMALRVLVFFTMLGLIFADPASAQETGKRQQATYGSVSEGVALSPQEMFRRISPAVVIVEILDPDDSVIGRASGVVVASEEVVTNRHVVDAGMIWRVKQGDKNWSAFPKYIDPDHDLATLKVDGLNAPAVSLRLSSTLAVGERVYAIGSPRGLELTLTEGLISGLREYQNGRLIQTSAAMSPGSSGGGLFDTRGRLLGITSFGISESQNLNFALPAEWVQALVPTLLSVKVRQPVSDPGEVFSSALTALNNLQTMVYERRFAHDTSFKSPIVASAASWLTLHGSLECLKDAQSSDCSNNWPLWEKTSLFMLQLREEIRAAGASRDDIEKVFLERAATTWKGLVDVYCKDKPGSFFTDLENEIRACPDAH